MATRALCVAVLFAPSMTSAGHSTRMQDTMNVLYTHEAYSIFQSDVVADLGNSIDKALAACQAKANAIGGSQLANDAKPIGNYAANYGTAYSYCNGKVHVFTAPYMGETQYAVGTDTVTVGNYHDGSGSGDCGLGGWTFIGGGMSWNSDSSGKMVQCAVTTAVLASIPATSSAVGDPHMQNVHGERFDLMVPGSHLLVNIPRGEVAENALLRVQADARRLGKQCADMYFQEVNVTGSWAEAKQAGGYHYSASQREGDLPEWVVFNKVQLKIVHGHTDMGLSYLNVYVKHLGRTGFVVGGLLGEDDHSVASTPEAACMNHLSLETRAQRRGSVFQAGSTAEGSFP
ncbi:unnamed protein product [Prorocentrum cordatum]|uniref:Uncharacterized protein n=1 Tax=Prorocentrum cordatum TaxID=2364126 RepID=A0ABN9WD88_9DINO|nr:unnamed protein product [Polarella glacialis]